MKDQTKAKLQIGKADDKAIAEAENTIEMTAKDFIASKPWAKEWDQATHARWILYVIADEWENLSEAERAVFALRAGNASAFRQALVKAKHISGAQLLDDYS